jgi:hypothetical protein
MKKGKKIDWCLFAAHFREATLSLASSVGSDYRIDAIRIGEAKKELAESVTPWKE